MASDDASCAVDQEESHQTLEPIDVATETLEIDEAPQLVAYLHY